MIAPYLFSVFKEKALGIQAGEAVFFCRLYELSAFAQLYDAGYAREYHLMHVERLGYEVGGSHLKGSEFSFFFRSHHYDRDPFQIRVVLKRSQHLKAVHHWHDEIEQYYRQPVLVFTDQVESFFPVLRIQYVVVISEYRAEDVAVELLILYNENEMSSIKLFGVYHLCSLSPIIRRASVSFSRSVSTGFERCASMPASRQLCTSL